MDPEIINRICNYYPVKIFGLLESPDEDGLFGGVTRETKLYSYRV